MRASIYACPQVQDDGAWWGQLKGESLRLMIANAEHSMATGVLELIPAAEAWVDGVLAGNSAPSFNWTISDADGSITVSVDPAWKPERVVPYMVTTLDSERRDFRLVSGDTPANPCKYIPVEIFGKARRGRWEWAVK